MRLARMGALNLKLADPDTFELTNVQRQFGASRDTIGRNKAEVVAEEIAQLTGDMNVDVFPDEPGLAAPPRRCRPLGVAGASRRAGRARLAGEQGVRPQTGPGLRQAAEGLVVAVEDGRPQILDTHPLQEFGLACSAIRAAASLR